MNYEKKYKEALERAKKLYEQGTITESLNFVFPELKKSDEQIRKEIFQFVYEQRPEDDWLAWLEKQRGRYSDWSEEDEKIFQIQITKN